MIVKLPSSISVEYEDAGRGTPIVLLHAFPLNKEMWQPQFAGLQTDCRLIAVNYRGIGLSGPLDDAPTMEKFADDVAGLIDALQIAEQPIVCGVSMGGYVALAYSRKYPSKLRALILADTRGEPDDETGKANREKMIDFAQSHSSTEVAEQLMPKLVGEQTKNERRQVVDEVIRIAGMQTPAGVVGCLRAMRDRLDAREWLSTIEHPTLVIVGEDDVLTPPAMSEKLAAGIAGAQLTRLAGSGHLSNLEQPEAFNNAVRLFVRSLKS